MLAGLLGSRLRAKVLGWLFTHTDESFYGRRLALLLGEDSTNISRELARLAEIGVLACRQEGRQRYYQANSRCPVFAELRGLAVKTIGLGDAIRDALTPLADRIHVAFLFGSFAAGRESSESDIDMLVVGKVSLRDLSARLGPVSRATGREINTVVYSPSEFKQRSEDGHPFVVNVFIDVCQGVYGISHKESKENNGDPDVSYGLRHGVNHLCI